MKAWAPSSALGAAFREALSRDEFDLWLQPVVDLAGRRPTAVEALPRWTMPGGEVLPTEELGPLAAALHLLPELATWTLRRACLAVRGHGVPDPGLDVYVNVSAAQLGDDKLLVAVRQALCGSGLPAERLILQVAASSAPGSPAGVPNVLAGLADLGVKLAVDDFGVGPSSLSLLHCLRPAQVKLDRSLIDLLGSSDPRDLAFVQGIVALGTMAGADVTAAGIESLDQVDRLRAMGCRFGQGRLWSEALPVAELLDIVRTGVQRPGGTMLAAPLMRRASAAGEDARAIAVITGLRRTGASPATIAAALNSQGFTRAAGKQWHANAVARLIERVRAPRAVPRLASV